MRHFWESARYVSARRNSVFRLPLANRIRTTRCGGTVTVRFRFSFYPRFGGLFFSFSLCFFPLHSSREGERSERDGTALRAARKGWIAPRGYHARCTGVIRRGDLHATRYSQKRNFTEVIFIGITQLPSKCVSHNFRDGGDHCRMNILSLHYATHFLFLSLFLPKALIYIRANK